MPYINPDLTALTEQWKKDNPRLGAAQINVIITKNTHFINTVSERLRSYYQDKQETIEHNFNDWHKLSKLEKKELLIEHFVPAIPFFLDKGFTFRQLILAFNLTAELSNKIQFVKTHYETISQYLNNEQIANLMKSSHVMSRLQAVIRYFPKLAFLYKDQLHNINLEYDAGKLAEIYESRKEVWDYAKEHYEELREFLSTKKLFRFIKNNKLHSLQAVVDYFPHLLHFFELEQLHRINQQPEGFNQLKTMYQERKHLAFAEILYQSVEPIILTSQLTSVADIDAVFADDFPMSSSQTNNHGMDIQYESSPYIQEAEPQPPLSASSSMNEQFCQMSMNSPRTTQEMEQETSESEQQTSLSEQDIEEIFSEDSFGQSLYAFPASCSSIFPKPPTAGKKAHTSYSNEQLLTQLPSAYGSPSNGFLFFQQVKPRVQCYEEMTNSKTY